MSDFKTKPWGYELILNEDVVNEKFVVKKIVVNPGHRLSLQKHSLRKEFWTIVQGTAVVEVEGKENTHRAPSAIQIEKFEIHRVENIGLQDLIIIETQYGVCDDDDIIRLEDDYGRLSCSGL